jgi:uncharacterized 2Fe-2S/4Fe-4S cluster protein (DUF4445 family)
MSGDGKEFRIVFRTEGGADAAAFARAGTTLLAAAREAGAAIDAPCGGAGTCGKCRVKLLSGAVESARGRHISEEDFAAGYRLACESAVIQDAEIFVPESALAWQSRIRVNEVKDAKALAKTRRVMERFTLDDGRAGVRCVRADLAAPSLDDAQADRERLLTATGAADISLSALRKLPLVLRENDFSVYCLIRGAAGASEGPSDEAAEQAPGAPGGPGGTIIGVNARPIRPVGLAVDIGTTTVSALLTDLASGDILAAGSAGNGQIRYGADVINRLIEGARPGGAERLRKAVTDECLVPLIRGVCAAAPGARDAAGATDSGAAGAGDETNGGVIVPADIARVSIAGNTTMLHLLLGVFGNNIRTEPYVPAFFGAGALRGADLGLGINPDAGVVICPSVGSYVGGDITAGVLASGVYKEEENTVFIDLGTNGEIVLAGDGFLMSCACSAGPAFEGGEMSCGMRATDGAIEAVAIDEESMEPSLTVIGDLPPVGICGSGLIDIISELFRCRIIDARGKLIRSGKRVKEDGWGSKYYVVAEGQDGPDGRDVFITEPDIDNFIRAKGSVFSAIRTMLELTGMTPDDIGRVYIAGGIGGAIDIGSAIRIGMLPALPQERYAYIGNTSLTGAYAALLSAEARARLAEIQGSMTYIELSSHPGYMDEFIAACFLPHTDASLFEGAL